MRAILVPITITAITSWPSGSGDIVTYIDADEKNFEPQMFIRHPQIKIIAPSSPRGTNGLTFATAPWTDGELFVTGFVTSPRVWGLNLSAFLIYFSIH